MKWLVNGEMFTCAWEAADFITDGNNAVTAAYNLERMYDGEESEVNGYTVASYIIYE